MPLKIKLDSHEFILSNQALSAMAQSLLKTKIKERGMMLCQGFTPVTEDILHKVAPEKRLVGEITPGQEHLGGAGSIGIRNCHDKARVGHFHTHPNSESAPSWHDAFSILAESSSLARPFLGCRAGTTDKTIRCDTASRLPASEELAYLRRKRGRMRYTWAEKDPEIWKHMGPSYSFHSDRIPDIIRVQPKAPEKPTEKPRIFTVFANKRAEVVALIRQQFPEITVQELDNARVTYHNGSAVVEI